MTQLLWMDGFQLSAQRCSKLAISLTSSMCFMDSASPAIPPHPARAHFYPAFVFGHLVIVRGPARRIGGVAANPRCIASQGGACVRRKGLKCSLSRSNSSESGAESLERCSWAIVTLHFRRFRVNTAPLRTVQMYRARRGVGLTRRL